MNLIDRFRLISQYFSDRKSHFFAMDKDFSFPLMLDLKQTEKPRITIGYYKLRGKAQVPRLLCEYLGVPYEDKLYDLKEWEKYRR